MIFMRTSAPNNDIGVDLISDQKPDWRAFVKVNSVDSDIITAYKLLLTNYVYLYCFQQVK
jgi:hypothetical protein